MISNETVLFNDSPLTTLPNTILGYRENGKAIYTIAGGAADVTVGDDDNDDEDDSDDDDGGSTQDADTWTPPTREDYDKLLAGKQKADSEAAARKRFLRDAGFDPKTGKPIAKPSVELDDDDDTDTTVQTDATKQPGFDRDKYEKQFQRQLERETSKAEGRGRTTAYSLISEVPSALEEAGWNGKNLPRMIKLLDLDAVEVDADGVDADALNEQVAELKRDFPEFFKRARMKEAAKDVADTAAVGGGQKKAPASEEDMDWKDRLRAQLYGGN